MNPITKVARKIQFAPVDSPNRAFRRAPQLALPTKANTQGGRKTGGLPTSPAGAAGMGVAASAGKDFTGLACGRGAMPATETSVGTGRRRASSANDPTINGLSLANVPLDGELSLNPILGRSTEGT